MIIENGTIQFKCKSLPTRDKQTGYFLFAKSPEWSEPVPCQYIPSRRDNLAVTSQGEHYTNTGYTILVDICHPVVSEQIKLTSDCGETLGEFSVISVEDLVAVGQRRINV